MWKLARKVLSASLIGLPTDALSQSVTPNEAETIRVMKGVQQNQATVGRWDRVADIKSIAGNQVGNFSQAVGLDASVYRDRYSGETKLFYRGSDGLPTSVEGAKDWTTNIAQLKGLPTPSYNLLGPVVARSAVEKYGISQCVGYSQGGGVATASCPSLGISTVTANPAGLSFINQLGVDSNKIKNFRSGRDLVSFGSTLGSTIDLGSSFSHDIADLSALMDARALDATRKDLMRTGTSLSIENARMPEGMGRAWGTPCLDFYHLGDAASCDDGSYISPADRAKQAQEMLPQTNQLGVRGCPPGDPARCWWR